MVSWRLIGLCSSPYEQKAAVAWHVAWLGLGGLGTFGFLVLDCRLLSARSARGHFLFLLSVSFAFLRGRQKSERYRG